MNEHADRMALAREQLASEAGANAARIGESAADRAQRSADNAANRELQRALAEMEKETRTLAIMLDAAQASGYIPQGLASKLGMKPGPTLQMQQFAWTRFMDAMKMASNPRDIVSSLFLQHGIQPSEGAPIPFLQALATGQPLPETNIGANQAAIGQAAREFTARQLGAMPSLVQGEAINPEAFAPIGGAGGFLDVLGAGLRGRIPGTMPNAGTSLNLTAPTTERRIFDIPAGISDRPSIPFVPRFTGGFLSDLAA